MSPPSLFVSGFSCRDGCGSSTHPCSSTHSPEPESNLRRGRGSGHESSPDTGVCRCRDSGSWVGPPSHSRLRNTTLPPTEDVTWTQSQGPVPTEDRTRTPTPRRRPGGKRSRPPSRVGADYKVFDFRKGLLGVVDPLTPVDLGRLLLDFSMAFDEDTPLSADGAPVRGEG